MAVQEPAYERITTSTDTEIIAAPGLGRRIRIYSMTIDIEVAGTSSKALVEKGAGGDKMASLDTTDDNNRLERVYHADRTSGIDLDGYPLPANTALSVNTTGAPAATLLVNVVYGITG